MNGKAFPFLLIVGLAVLMICSPVSAEVFTEEYGETSKELNQYRTGDGGTTSGLFRADTLRVYKMDVDSEYEGINFWTYEGNGCTISGDDTGSASVLIGGTNVGIISWQKYKNFLGQQTKIRLWIHFSADLPTGSGEKSISISGHSFTGTQGIRGVSIEEENSDVGRMYVKWQDYQGYNYMLKGDYQTVVKLDWQTIVNVDSEQPHNIEIFRFDNPNTYQRIESGVIKTEDNSDRDIVDITIADAFTTKIISLTGKEYVKDWAFSGGPLDNTVSIITRVKSLSDNSLIAGSKVYYRALDGSDLVNQTLPSGSDVFLLQKNVEYEFWAEASGYGNQTVNPFSISFSGDSQNDILMVPTLEDPDEGTGLYNFYISEQTDATGSSTPLTSPATIALNGETKLTTSAGYASFEVNKTVPITYKITKSGYESVSRTYTPNWPGNSINDFITLRPEGQVLPGDPTAAPTPDHRTDTQRAEAAFSIIFSNIEAFATLTCIVLLLSFIKWMKL